MGNTLAWWRGIFNARGNGPGPKGQPTGGTDSHRHIASRRKPMPRLCALLLRTACVLLALTGAATAQDYPTHPVRIIVPFPPGGFNDIVGRIVAAQLSERLGKQFVVENKPGAGGIIAGEMVANAPKDGHTLLIVSLAITVNPHFYKMPYDT